MIRKFHDFLLHVAKVFVDVKEAFCSNCGGSGMHRVSLIVLRLLKILFFCSTAEPVKRPEPERKFVVQPRQQQPDLERQQSP